MKRALRSHCFQVQLGEQLMAPSSKELEKLRSKTGTWKKSLLPKLSHMIVLGERHAWHIAST